MNQILSGSSSDDKRRMITSTGSTGSRDRRRGSRESLEMAFDGEEVSAQDSTEDILLASQNRRNLSKKA